MTNSLDPAAATYFGVYRGVVIDNIDPTDSGRVQVEVPAVAPSPLAWAPVVGGRHLEVGDAVFVSFEGGDVEYPVVLGSIGGAPSGPSLPAGSNLVVDDGTGTIELHHGSGTVVSIGPDGGVSIQAVGSIELTAPVVNIDSPLVTAAGVLQAQTLIAAVGVVSPSYTPGVGNIS